MLTEPEFRAGDDFSIVSCDLGDGVVHLAVVVGDVTDHGGVLVRIQRECLPGDLFDSCCPCRRRMHHALSRIRSAGAGVVVYLRGARTCVAPHADAAVYHAAAAEILRRLGVRAAHVLVDQDEEAPPASGLVTEIVPLREGAPAGLTHRETEVISLLAEGLMAKQIAVRLAISPRTVRHHIEHIYDKIGVSTRAAATAFAFEHGMATPAPLRDGSAPASRAA